MNKMVYLTLVTLLGSFGAWAISPFWGVFVYYHLALLRPQFLWAWDLPMAVNWSMFVAVFTIAAAAARIVVDFGRPQTETGEPPIPASPVYLPMFLLAVWVSITSLTADNKVVAFYWVWEYIKIWIMFGAAAVLIRTRLQVYALYGMACVTMVYLAYEVNFQYLVTRYLGVYHNGLGGYDNNGAGLMLAMTIPLCYFAFEAFTRWWRYLFLVAPLGLLHGVLLTYSRGAMLSLVLAIPLMLLRSRHRWQLSIAVGIFAIAGLPMLAGKEIQDRFVTISKSDADASARSRWDSWRAGWLIACDYPLFGVGVRNSNLFTQQYGADIQGRTIHNQYLQVAADSGFIGAALYLLMLYSTWRRCARREPDSTRLTHRTFKPARCWLGSSVRCSYSASEQSSYHWRHLSSLISLFCSSLRCRAFCTASRTWPGRPINGRRAKRRRTRHTPRVRP